MNRVFAPRTPWTVNFPDIIIHSEVSIRNCHSAYVAAKAGNPAAAITLVRDLLNNEAVDLLRRTTGPHDVTLAAVSAIEKTGFNAIPDAMEHEIGKRLGFPVDTGDLVQINKVAHNPRDRLAPAGNAAAFWGEVKQGRDYVLVDDHVGLGGTLANMRGYIEANGGKVIAMTTLTESAQHIKSPLSLKR
jgi:phosphoribosylpyrophosphate synthetase